MSRKDSRIKSGDQAPEAVPAPAHASPPVSHPPAATDGAEASPPTAEHVTEHHAGLLADSSAAAFLYASMAADGFFLKVEAPAYKRYRDKFLADCGSPTDPIEIMLIEQLILAHFNAGRLHHRAAAIKNHSAAKVYSTMAVQLMSEFRCSAMALKSYREGPQVGETKTPLVTETIPPLPDVREWADSELASNPGGDDHDGAIIPLAQESPAGRGRPIEPSETARPELLRA